MTILEALNWGRKEIKSTLHEKMTQGHNPMIDTQVLLSFCLNKPTAYLFSHFEDKLPTELLDKYKALIERRLKHEPVAYIVGFKEFYKRPFKVNKFVLVPRPETEQMVDEALKLIEDNTSVIDVGTGSGAIAVTIAAEKHIPVIAIDIDQNALTIAKANAKLNKVDNLISFLNGSLLAPYIEKNIHDRASSKVVITANLPYAKIQQWPILDPDILQFEPKHAIVGGVDGLELYDGLLSQIKNYKEQFPSKIHLLLEIDPS